MPGKPTLFPGVPQGTSIRGGGKKGSSTKKGETLESPNGMVRQTTEYNIAEAQMNQRKVSLSNNLFKILKERHHGDMNAYSNDPEVQQALAIYQNERASLAASRNQVESEKEYKEAAVSTTDKNKGTDKYYVDDRGQRRFLGVDGRAYTSGQKYKTRDGKVHTAKKRNDQDYLTYGEWYKVKENNASMGKNKYGVYTVEQNEWTTSVDYNKDEISTYVTGILSKAGSDTYAGGTSAQMFGNSFMKVNGHHKTDLKKLTQMADVVNDTLPSNTRVQMKQKYWEEKHDDDVLLRTKTGGQFINKNQYAMIKDQIKEGTSAADLGISKELYSQIKSGNNTYDNENIKFAFYTQNIVGKTANAMATDERGDYKFIKLSDSEVGFNMERKKATEASAHSVAANINAANPDKAIRKTIYQKQANGKYLAIDVATGISHPESIATKNAYDKANKALVAEHFDDDGEAKLETFTRKNAVSNESNIIVLPNGQLLEGDMLNKMYVVHYNEATVSHPSYRKNKKTGEAEYDIHRGTDKEGNELSDGKFTTAHNKTGHYMDLAMDIDDFTKLQETMVTSKSDSGNNYDGTGKPPPDAYYKAGQDELVDDGFIYNSVSKVGENLNIELGGSDGSPQSGVVYFRVYVQDDQFGINTEYKGGGATAANRESQDAAAHGGQYIRANADNAIINAIRTN